MGRRARDRGAAAAVDRSPASLLQTYKQLPGGANVVSIADAYGRAHAEQVVLAAMADYEESFGAAADASGEGQPGASTAERN